MQQKGRKGIKCLKKKERKHDCRNAQKKERNKIIVKGGKGAGLKKGTVERKESNVRKRWKGSRRVERKNKTNEMEERRK